jgi:transposase-like protein
VRTFQPDPNKTGRSIPRHHPTAKNVAQVRNYHSDARPAYECSARADRLTTPTCRSIAASTVDAVVAERLLEALNPNEIALALAAADEVADRRQRGGRAAELAVDRARYEADRAERAFHAVERENRLVASTLETRWETKLAALVEAEQALEAARRTLPPLPGGSVRLVREHRDDYDSEWAAMKAIAGRLGMNVQTLRRWVRQDEIDTGEAAGMSSDDRRELRELRRKNRELESTIEILKAATTFFARECDPLHR